MMLASSGWAPPASASSTAYEFRIVKYATATVTVPDEHHQLGDWIKVTGEGSFDTSTGAIEGAGSFTHYNVNGTVHMQGAWVASAFTSFTPFDAPVKGKQGGVLWLTVNLYDETGALCTCMGSGGVAMSLTSTLNAPPGTVGGITLGPFGQPTGGTISIALEG